MAVVLCSLAPAMLAAVPDFKQRAGWNQLDREVLLLLERRLTAAELQKFVQMSESMDLVRKRYWSLAGPKVPQSPGRAPFVVASMAVLFTDVANDYGEKNDLRNAGAYAAMALKLNPNHVPAMFTLIAIYLRTGNCHAAKSLIELGRETLARLKKVPPSKLPEPDRSAQAFDGMSRQLDLFAKSCP
jgi:hypothetical protein